MTQIWLVSGFGWKTLFMAPAQAGACNTVPHAMILCNFVPGPHGLPFAIWSPICSCDGLPVKIRVRPTEIGWYYNVYWSCQSWFLCIIHFVLPLPDSTSMAAVSSCFPWYKNLDPFLNLLWLCLCLPCGLGCVFSPCKGPRFALFQNLKKLKFWIPCVA